MVIFNVITRSSLVASSPFNFCCLLVAKLSVSWQEMPYIFEAVKTQKKVSNTHT